MFKRSAFNQGTPSGVQSPTGLKPLMLGLQQPQGGAADPTKPQAPGAPPGMPTSQDPAGAALQEQDIRRGQEALAELEATKQELKTQKAQGSGYQAADSFVGARVKGVTSRLAGLNKSLVRLNQQNMKVANQDVPAPLTAPNTIKPPSLDKWNAADAHNKSINTSLLTHTLGGKQQDNTPNQGWFNAPKPWMGGTSPRNVVEGFNEVLHNGADAWDSHGWGGLKDLTGTNMAASIPENGIFKRPAQALDAVTALPARMLRGLPRLFAGGGSFLAGPAGPLGDVARDAGNLVGQVANKGMNTTWDDVNTRLPESLSNAGQGALSAGSLIPGPTSLARAGAMGLGGLLMGAKEDPAQLPAAQPTPMAPAPEGADNSGDYLAPIMALLEQLGTSVSPYLSSLRGNAPQQRDLPSVAGAGGHEVRNPMNYVNG